MCSGTEREGDGSNCVAERRRRGEGGAETCDGTWWDEMVSHGGERMARGRERINYAFRRASSRTQRCGLTRSLCSTAWSCAKACSVAW